MNRLSFFIVLDGKLRTTFNEGAVLETKITHIHDLKYISFSSNSGGNEFFYKCNLN